MKLETVKIKICTDSLDQYHIDCPNCDMWESLGIDDSRSMLNAIPIISGGNEISFDTPNEISVNKCSECYYEFEVEWDYENTCCDD